MKPLQGKSGKTPFSWKARGRSFIYAFRGIRRLVTDEHNARIHCVAAFLAVLCCILLKVSAQEWAIILLCIGCVFSAEAVNSAVEAICDKISPEYSPFVEKAKDIAAAAVLILAIVSLAIGLIIFLPRVINLLNV